MNKEELHKAAEEYYAKVDPANNDDEWFLDPIDEWFFGKKEMIAFAAAFHIHQTKKMLEAWTDEKIMDEYWEDAFGIMHFRDELLKQLEK